MHDSMGLQEQQVVAQRAGWIEELVESLKESLGEERPKKKSGRPQQVPWVQIVAGVLVSVLFGMNNYQQLWRRLRRKDLAGFAPISVQDDAIIKRLKQAGTTPFERLLEQLGQQPAVQGTAVDLLPFAPKIVAIDEMTGDQMQRQLKEQRSLKKGDKQLLPGKLAGRYNIRSQQWERVQWREDAQANCKVDVMSLLVGLEQGSVLLFDLGYFAFWWFDELSQRGYRWVSRLREKTSYELVHVFWRAEGHLDALVWLGAHRADRAGKMVRLVRFWDGKQLHTYITNMLDPRQASMKTIAQLYARRWDIELAFLLLKQYLGLHHWWSSQPVLMQQQCLALIIVAQQVQRLRMQMAMQAGVDAFEVSLPLLLEVLPEVLQERQEPLEWMKRMGRELVLIRPDSRHQQEVPEVKEEQLLLAAPELPQQRAARYHSYGAEQATRESNVTQSKTATAKKRSRRRQEASRQGATAAQQPQAAGEQAATTGRAEPAEQRQQRKGGEKDQKTSDTEEQKQQAKGGEKSHRARNTREKMCQMQHRTKEGLPQFSG